MIFSDHCRPMTKRLLLLLFLKSIFITFIIFYAGIGLGPDEAQYWTWSRALDWGYYSKPPGIAWQIWLGTFLFGHTEWGVRSLSVIFALIQSLLIYKLALRSGLSPKISFWSALFMALCPMGIMGSFFAITDIGFLLCWTGACSHMVYALQCQKPINPMLIGGWILFGALFKWPIYFFWVFFLLCTFWYFPKTSGRKVMSGILLSLVGLLPSLWWNWSHDWATLRHVSATLQGGHAQQISGNFIPFIGSQMALISPILFILLLIGICLWVRQRQVLPPAIMFCGCVTILSLFFAFSLSCFQKIQGNWVIFAYPTGFILIGWLLSKKPRLLLFAKGGLFISLLLTLLIFSLPSFYQYHSSYAPNYRLNPFKHNLGWSSLAKALERHQYDPDKHFLFSDKYQMSSVLSFYSTGQKRAYFLNLQKMRKNQFSYWPGLYEERTDQEGYFVWTENAPALHLTRQEKMQFYEKELARFFEKIEFLEAAPLVYDGPMIVKMAFLFRCSKYKEEVTIDEQLY